LISIGSLQHQDKITHTKHQDESRSKACESVHLVLVLSIPFRPLTAPTELSVSLFLSRLIDSQDIERILHFNLTRPCPVPVLFQMNKTYAMKEKYNVLENAKCYTSANRKKKNQTKKCF